MKVLFLGDIFANTGKRIIAQCVPELVERYSIDICVANAENIAGGRGITHNLFKKLRKFGVQVMTGGNHSLSCPDSFNDYTEDPYLLRPHNMPPGNIGKGTAVYTLPDGRSLGVINLQGRTFFHEQYDCPFRIGLLAIEQMLEVTRNIIVDFHAEATSEKKAFAYYADGKVSAVLGTHTHVQTADESISPAGTAFITDVGMNGPGDSIIGMKKEQVLKRFLTQSAQRFEPAEGMPQLNAVVLAINDTTGKTESIQRIFELVTFHD
jgi:2',3'-cyclic-nucleotide 2'-phosphodiesterase